MPRSSLRRTLPGLCLPALALLSGGCGEREAKMVPAEGVVKINGKPAPDVAVQFMPDAMKGGFGPTSFGTSGPDGTFKLQTHTGQDGAAVGPHRVVLVDLTEERVPQGKVSRKPIRLDPRYAIATSGLETEVTEGGGPITLDALSPGK